MVKRTFLSLVLLAIVVGLAGCQTAPKEPPRSPEWTKGILREHDVIVKVDNVYDDADKIVEGAATVDVRLASGTGYEAYLRPDQGRTPPGLDAWAILYSHPSIYLNSGWAYATGSYPTLLTKRIKASGSGTRMLVEYADYSPYSPFAGYRVYVLEEPFVTCTANVYDVEASPTAPPLTDLPIAEKMYVKIGIKPGGALDPSGPYYISTDPGLEEHVNRMVNEANDAGVLP